MKIAFAVLAASLLCAVIQTRSSVLATQAGSPYLVLKMQSLTHDAGNTATIVLASGTKIRVPASDISSDMTAKLHTVFNPQSPAPASPSSATIVPTPAQATPGIRQKCAEEWPRDFTMQKYCQDQQQKAIYQLWQRTMSSPNQITIRTKCAGDWPRDFLMWNYCEEQQLKALAAISR